MCVVWVRVKRPEEEAKWRPEWPQELQVGPQLPPNGPKLASTWGQVGPKLAQVGAM